jgi:hypothetical protein
LVPDASFNNLRTVATDLEGNMKSLCKQLNRIGAHIVSSAGVLLAWITKANDERALHVARTRFRAAQHG